MFFAVHTNYMDLKNNIITDKCSVFTGTYARCFSIGCLFLLFSAFLITPGKLQAQAVIKIGPENNYQFFSPDPAETIGRFDVLCHKRPQNGRVRAGVARANRQGVTVWRLMRNFRRQRVSRMEARGLPEQRINRVKKRFRPRPRMIVCRETHENSPELNAPVANQLSVNTDELTPVQISLSATDPKGLNLAYEIVSGPSGGTLSGQGATIQYSPKGHFIGTDTFQYRAHNGDFASNTAKVTINVASMGGEFVGDKDSLEPYRPVLSYREAQHIVKKVAYSDPNLLEIGVNQGLDALIDAMLDSPEVPGIEQAAFDLAEPLFSVGGTAWNANSSYRYWDYISRYGNPFRARMALFWHEHLPTSIGPLNINRAESHHHIRIYMDDLIRDNVLGNFVDDLLKGYLWSVAGASHYLDNRFNHLLDEDEGTIPNQNYPRELLELFALGTHGVGDRKDLPMFTEDDVVAATAYMSGFKSYQVNDQEDEEHGKVVLTFDSDLHDFNTYSIFQGQPWEASNVNFMPEEFIDYLVYNNENAARFIGEKLYAQLVSPNTSEEIVEAMAALMIKHSFEIKPVLRVLLSSSAMFSENVRKVCIESAYEKFVGLMRKLDFPFFDDSTLMDDFRDAVRDAGQRPLEPDTVFAWENNCGVNRGGNTFYGEQYVSSQLILGEQRGLVSMLQRLGQLGFNWASLLPNLSATPEETIAHFEKIFDLSLTTAEKEHMVVYMTNSKNHHGNLLPLEWDTTNSALMKIKISGLVEMFFLHPRARLK